MIQGFSTPFQLAVLFLSTAVYSQGEIFCLKSSILATV